MKLTSDQSADIKRRYKVVRRDDCTDVSGEIVAADEETGDCQIQSGGELKTFSFGEGGIRIVGRGRW